VLACFALKRFIVCDRSVSKFIELGNGLTGCFKDLLPMTCAMNRQLNLVPEGGGSNNKLRGISHTQIINLPLRSANVLTNGFVNKDTKCWDGNVTTRTLLGSGDF
jgi:hypothetical protein